MPDKTALELWDALVAKHGYHGSPFVYGPARDGYRDVLAALEEVKERENQVCEGYELCRHVGCAASYTAFAIADAALATERARIRGAGRR